MEFLYTLMDAVLPFEALRMDFMKNALLALLLLTPLLSLLGTMAVNKRMAFFSDALGHSALAGVGLGMVVGISNELVSLLIFGIIWAVLIAAISRSGRSSADTTISVFSSTAMALGLLLLSMDGSFGKYSQLLTGDILSIRPSDLAWLLLALLAGVIFWALCYNKLLLTAISPQLSQSRGVKTHLVEYLFMGLVAVSVMLSIRWVGVLLINALLILPAAAARNVSKSSFQHALVSVLMGLVSGIAGLFLAYYLNTGVGAAVVLCAALCYFASLPVARILKR